MNGLEKRHSKDRPGLNRAILRGRVVSGNLHGMAGSELPGVPYSAGGRGAGRRGIAIRCL